MALATLSLTVFFPTVLMSTAVVIAPDASVRIASTWPVIMLPNSSSNFTNFSIIGLPTPFTFLASTTISRSTISWIAVPIKAEASIISLDLPSGLIPNIVFFISLIWSSNEYPL